MSPQTTIIRPGHISTAPTYPYGPDGDVVHEPHGLCNGHTPTPDQCGPCGMCTRCGRLHPDGVRR